VLNVDAALSGLLGKLYNHNMLFDPDETLKGDAQAVARGATSLMQMESLRLRRNEVLQVTNNPTDLQIMGLPGRAELLRTTFDDLDVDVSRVIPSREKMAAMAAGPQPGPQPGQQPGAPAQQPPPPPGPGMNQETLDNGAPTTDNFSPNGMRPVQGFAEGGVVQGVGAAWRSELDQRNASVGAPDPTMYRSEAKNMRNVRNYIAEQGGVDPTKRQAPTATDVLNKFQAGQGAAETPPIDSGPAPFDDQAPTSSLLDIPQVDFTQYSNLFDML
jgi:hypothetical protein